MGMRWFIAGTFESESGSDIVNRGFNLDGNWFKSMLPDCWEISEIPAAGVTQGPRLLLQGSGNMFVRTRTCNASVEIYEHEFETMNAPSRQAECS